MDFKKYKCDIENEEMMKKQFETILKEKNMIPMFIEQGGENVSDIDWKEYQNDHVCFVLGSEAIGIPDYILNLKKKYSKSKIISIPQLGHGRSLNVATSCGIVLYKYMESMSNMKNDCNDMAKYELNKMSTLEYFFSSSFIRFIMPYIIIFSLWCSIFINSTIKNLSVCE